MFVVFVGRCDGCIGESNVIVELVLAVGSVVVVAVARCWCVMVVVVLLVGSNRHWGQSFRS